MIKRLFALQTWADSGLNTHVSALQERVGTTGNMPIKTLVSPASSCIWLFTYPPGGQSAATEQMAELLKRESPEKLLVYVHAGKDDQSTDILMNDCEAWLGEVNQVTHAYSAVPGRGFETLKSAESLLAAFGTDDFDRLFDEAFIPGIDND